jgi:molybdenum cofactor biosynthesis enzyme
MPNPVTEHHFCPDPSDLALDKAIVARVFGHSLTDGPNNALAVTAGVGRAARLVELLPVSTDLTATSKAVSVALAAGHADGLHTGAMLYSPHSRVLQ